MAEVSGIIFPSQSLKDLFFKSFLHKFNEFLVSSFEIHVQTNAVFLLVKVMSVTVYLRVKEVNSYEMRHLFKGGPCITIIDLLHTFFIGERYSNWLQAGQLGFRVPVGSRFSLLHVVQTGSGTHPASYPMGTGAFSLGIKQPGLEADHSPPTSADVKKTWIYTSTPPCLYGIVLN
jgi:hypothetical protein